VETNGMDAQSNFPQKVIQNLNLQIQQQQQKKNRIKSTEKTKTKMDNLHILQPKNKENYKPIQAHKQRNIL